MARQKRKSSLSPGNADEANQRRSLRPLATLVPYMFLHKGMVALALAALIVSAGAMLALPLGVRRMIDFGFSNENPDLIDQYFAMMLVIGLVLAIASSTRFYAVNWLGERVVANLRRDVFAHLARLSPAFYAVNHSGEVMSRLTADTTQIKSAAGSTASQALRNLVMLFGSITMMFITSVELSVLVVAVIPVVVLPLIAYGRVVRRLSRRPRIRWRRQAPMRAKTWQPSRPCRRSPMRAASLPGLPARSRKPSRRRVRVCWRAPG